MNELSFLNQFPWWLLVAFPILAIVFVLVERSQRALLEASHLPTGKKRILKVLVPLSLLALGGIALCRPYHGFEEIYQNDRGIDIAIAVDVSQSMLARDLTPNRLEVAKRKIRALLQGIRQRVAGTRISLIVFAGSAYTFCPLTSDYQILENFVDAIGPELMSSRGSDLARAVEQSVKSLSARSGDGLILLLSDGEDFNAPSMGDNPYRNLREQSRQKEFYSKRLPPQIKIFTIGLGTQTGAYFPGHGPGGKQHGKDGKPLRSHLETGPLEELAMMAHGRFLNSEGLFGDVQDFLSILEDIELSQREGDQVLRNYNELGPKICILILIALLSLLLIRRQELLCSFLLLSVFFPNNKLLAEPALIEEKKFYDASTAFQQGDFEKAENLFSELEDPYKSLPGLAASLYRQGKYEQSKKTYGKLARLLQGKERAEALYNKGNAEFQKREFQQAIESYEESLKLNPESIQAKENLETARKLLEQSPEDQQQQEQENERNKPKKNSSSDENEQANQNQEDKEESASEKDERPGEQEQESAEQDKDENRKNGENSEDSQQQQGKEPLQSQEESAGGSDSQESDSAKTGEDQQAEAAKEDDSSSEAKAWLNSFGDAPVLLHRQPRNTAESTTGFSW